MNLDSTLDVWDDQYPVESAMTDVIVDMIVKELTRSLGIPADKINDATDDRG